MVEGLDRFRAHFADYTDQYVLIGGAACDLVLDEAGLPFRATKDLDIVLTVDALTADFVNAFWAFIKEGEYEHQFKGADRKQYYRFQKPGKDGFPFMLELFSRQPDAIMLADDSHLTPIPTDDAISSLSAILLSDDYSAFIDAGRLLVDGLTVVGAEHLLSLKAKAWCELTQRKSNGEAVDSKDIRKHRNDVFRLFVAIDPEFEADIPATVRDDLRTFIEGISNEDIDLKSFGIVNLSLAEVLAELRRVYGID